MAADEVENALQLILRTSCEDLRRYPALVQQTSLHLQQASAESTPHQPEPVLSQPSHSESSQSESSQSDKWENIQAGDFTKSQHSSSIKKQRTKSQGTKTVRDQPGEKSNEIRVITLLRENIALIKELTENDNILTKHVDCTFLDDVARLFGLTPKDRAAGFAGLMLFDAQYQRYKSGLKTDTHAVAEFAEYLCIEWRTTRHYLDCMKKLEALKSNDNHWGICIALATVPVNTWIYLTEEDIREARKFISEHDEILRICGSTFLRFFERYYSKLLLHNAGGSRRNLEFLRFDRPNSLALQKILSLRGLFAPQAVETDSSMNSFQPCPTRTPAASNANSEEERSRNCPTCQDDDCGPERPHKRRRPFIHLPDSEFEQTTDSPPAESSTSHISNSDVHTSHLLSSGSQQPDDSDSPQDDAGLMNTSGGQLTESDSVQNDDPAAPHDPIGSGQFGEASQTPDEHMAPMHLGSDDRDWFAEFENMSRDFLDEFDSMDFLEDSLTYIPGG